jgi:hypothetical protein
MRLWTKSTITRPLCGKKTVSICQSRDVRQWPFQQKGIGLTHDNPTANKAYAASWSYFHNAQVLVNKAIDFTMRGWSSTNKQELRGTNTYLGITRQRNSWHFESDDLELPIASAISRLTCNNDIELGHAHVWCTFSDVCIRVIRRVEQFHSPPLIQWNLDVKLLWGQFLTLIWNQRYQELSRVIWIGDLIRAAGQRYNAKNSTQMCVNLKFHCISNQRGSNALVIF